MGFWLHKTFVGVRNLETFNAGTDVYDLPRKGIISNLLLELYAKSGSENEDIFLANVLSKIEVMGNGSTVIQSLDGRQIQAAAAYDDQKWPMDKELAPSGGCWGFFDIRFGRYPGDQKYALDCSKWDSLELKITYNLVAGGAINTTGFTASIGTIRVTGLFSPDGADLAPVGFIKKAEKKTYTSAASGTEDLSLPDDYPYRRLLLFQETKEHYPHEGFQYVTVNINHGARKPIDNLGGMELIRLQGAIAGNPLWRHWKRYTCLSASVRYVPPIRWITNAILTKMGSGAIAAIEVLENVSFTVVSQAGVPAVVEVSGYCPWGALTIDLERQSGKDGVEAMLDCWGYDQKADIDLEFTEMSDSLALSIVLEQYASHPV